jgi:hypothetical protein
LLQVNRTNILEARLGSTIKTVDIQIAKDPTAHASLNWLRIYSPILLDGIKVASATGLWGFRQLSPYFSITCQAGTKQPPKPSYSHKHHTRFESYNRA